MKELFIQVPCGHCEIYTKDGTRGCGCVDCNYKGYVYRSLSPADLAGILKGKIRGVIQRAGLDTKELRDLAEFCEDLANDLETDARIDSVQNKEKPNG